MRNHLEIERLFSITDVVVFHQQFETYFKICPKSRKHFVNDDVLQDFRKVYLLEFYVNQAHQAHEKILYLLDALEILANMHFKKMTALELLFLCHYGAKIHYELGVIWMEMHHTSMQEEGNLDTIFAVPSLKLSETQQKMINTLFAGKTNVLQLAISAFTAAKNSYELFKKKHQNMDDASFCQQSYQLYPSFRMFDEYSPWARLIVIACNYYLCVQEDEKSVFNNTLLLNDLVWRIKNQKDTRGSASHQAIAEVNKILKDDLLPLLETFSEERPFKKAKIALTSQEKTENGLSLCWGPIVTHKDAFNATFQTNSWVLPSFLRPRQQQDLQIIYEHLNKLNKPLVVTKPTGTGKTAEFTAVTNAAWQNRVPTIIVVPTATLAEQTRDKLVEYRGMPGMVYDTRHIGLFCPTKRSKSVGPITVVTQASYVRQVATALEKFPTCEALKAYMTIKPTAYLEPEVFFHPEFFSLLIVDEGHHVVGNRMFELIRYTPCSRPIILFSASTLPGEYPEIDEVCEHVVTQTLNEAIDANELAPIQALTLDFSMYQEAKMLTKSIRKRMQGKNELDAQSRQEIADLMCTNAGFSLTAISILKQVVEKVPTTKKMMVFTDSIDHANLLATLLSHLFKQNIQAFHTKAPERDAILHAFKHNQSRVIVAVGALDEGFDDVNVNVILDFSIYVSRIRRIMQRLGRALRLREDGSGAILISTKLLPKDLQLIPRDVIMGEQEHGYLGKTSQMILTEEVIHLSLPEPLTIPAQDNEPLREIRPQSAMMVFPMSRKRFKLGSPPQEEEKPVVERQVSYGWDELCERRELLFFDNAADMFFGPAQVDELEKDLLEWASSP